MREGAAYPGGSYVRTQLAGPAAVGSIVAIVDAERVAHVDATGVTALAELRDELGRENVELVMARARTPLLEPLREAGLEVPRYPTVRAAVEAGRGA